jgi:hypothetical protein
MLYCWSRDSVVGIATSYGLDDRGVGVRVPVGSRIFSSPRRPDRLWGPPSLLSNGYWGLFPRGWSDRGVKLTTHLELVPMSRKCGSKHQLPHTPSWRSVYLLKNHAMKTCKAVEAGSHTFLTSALDGLEGQLYLFYVILFLAEYIFNMDQYFNMTI